MRGNLLPILALLSKNQWWHSPPKYKLCEDLFSENERQSVHWKCGAVSSCDNCPIDNYKPSSSSLIWFIYKEYIHETQSITNPACNGIQET